MIALALLFAAFMLAAPASPLARFLSKKRRPPGKPNPGCIV
jgi:hypothetical protein